MKETTPTKSERRRSFSGAPWEPIFGYCRAMRIGDIVEVSGTTAMKNGQVVGPGDAYAQTKCILEIIEKSLLDLDARLTDIIRTRIYVTNVSLWKDIARAHQETFGDIIPVASMVEVSALMDPKLLVEIEAHAIVSDR